MAWSSVASKNVSHENLSKTINNLLEIRFRYRVMSDSMQLLMKDTYPNAIAKEKPVLDVQDLGVDARKFHLGGVSVDGQDL